MVRAGSVTLILHIASSLLSATAFVSSPPTLRSYFVERSRTSTNPQSVGSPLGVGSARGVGNAEDGDVRNEVKELLRLTTKSEAESDDRERIAKLVADLEQSSKDDDVDDDERFRKLLGLYTVAYVLTKNENENPVGGKWTRRNSLTKRLSFLFRQRTTFQHILPPRDDDDGAVAQAVNVISFRLLVWFRLTVVLRGDAVPLTVEERAALGGLTSAAVRAVFDPPLLALGVVGRETTRWPVRLSLGPSSRVVLDSPYVDDAVRVGVGGTSGTRFVFARAAAATAGESEANEFRAIAAAGPPIRRSRLSVLAATTGAAGAALTLRAGRATPLGTAALLAAALGGVVSTFSTGGIETNNDVDADETRSRSSSSSATPTTT